MSDRCFLSCDWGTSAFRLAVVDRRSGKILREMVGACGVRTFASSPRPERATRFHDCLQTEARKLIADSPYPVAAVVSGMASSSIGWIELPYAHTPFSLVGGGALVREAEPLRIRRRTIPVWLVSGVRTERDVMRGEETQLLGLAREIGSAGATVILPGTHSKHARIENGALVDFETFMTGELFATLTQSATLSPGDAGAFSRRDFVAGLREGSERPLSSALFRVRSRRLLAKRPPASDRDFLSGILIGAEITALVQRGATGECWIAGSPQMQQLYGIALREAGLRARTPRLASGDLVAAGHATIL